MVIIVYFVQLYYYSTMYLIGVFLSIIERGEENCQAEIEAHKECMRKMGFKI